MHGQQNRRNINQSKSFKTYESVLKHYQTYVLNEKNKSLLMYGAWNTMKHVASKSKKKRFEITSIM